MKLVHQILAFLNGSRDAKQTQKEDIKIQYNSTAFFLLGIIIASLGVWIIAESKFATDNIMAEGKRELPPEDDFFYYIDIKTDPKSEKPEKQEVKKVVKKVIEKVNPVDNNTKIDDPIVDTTDDTVNTPDKNPDTDDTIDDSPSTENNPIFLNVVEVVPAFPSCNYLSDKAARIQCLSDEINKIVTKRFDTSVVERLGLQGQTRIYVSFVVDTNGIVTDVKARAPHPQLEKEAKRVMGYIPKLIPGMQNNKPVNVIYNLPITLQAQ